MKFYYLLLALVALVPALASATTVRLQNLKDDTRLVSKATGEEIPLADREGSSIILDLTPGTYIISGTHPNLNNAPICSTEFIVKEPSAYPEGKIPTWSVVFVSLRTNNSKTVGEEDVDWALDEDFTVENFSVTDGSDEKVNATPAVYEWKGRKIGIHVLAFKNCTMSVDFVPTALHLDYARYEWQKVMTTSNVNEKFTFSELMTFTLSFPSNANGSLSYKKGSTNYVPFIPMTPDSESASEGITTYTYKLAKNSQEYCYRVSRKGAITCAGLVTPQKTSSVSVAEEQLSAHDNHYCAHQVGIEYPNSGTHYADIFLNINKRHLLRMEQGKQFHIVNLRTWQLTNNSTANYFVEPDYTWTVLNTDFQPDNSVVEIDDKGLLTAKSPGTAIVQVRYDAISLNAMDGNLWDALWAENTGTFVVTVSADASKAPADNIHLAYKPEDELDAEHDILYYLKGEDGYRLSFTPADGSTVTVANPLVNSESNTVSYPKAFSSDNVTVNADGSVTVLLTYGRNIIRTTDSEGNANYQVLSAKPATLDLITKRDDSYFLPGDDVTMQFDGLFHVAGKLASIYNSNCHIRYGDVTANDGVLLGTGQYDFAGSAAAQQFPISISSTQAGDLLIDGGCLNPQGYGSSPGAHRGLTYDKGMDPNFNAGVVSGAFGSLPAKTLKITQLKDVDRLKVTLPMGSRVRPVSPVAMEAAFGEGTHWVSSNPDIARVGEGGEIFPVSAGVVVLTAVNDQQRDNTPLMYCDVTVPENPDFVAVTGLSLTDTWSSETLGETFPLHMDFGWGNWGNYSNQFYAKVSPENATNKGVRVTSSNPDIVAVGKKTLGTWESSGNSVRVPLFWNDNTRMPGEALITVETLDGGYKKSVTVKWMRGADQIALEPADVTLGVGNTYEMDPVLTPEYTSYPVVWTSSDPTVATVDENGLVTAVAAGAAQIKGTVKASGTGNKTASANFTVVDQTVGIENAEIEAFRFGPNPCGGTLYVNSAVEAEIRIFSLDGTLKASAHLAAGDSTIDLNHLTTGIYVLHVNDKAYKLIRK